MMIDILLILFVCAVGLTGLYAGKFDKYGKLRLKMALNGEVNSPGKCYKTP